MIVGNAERMRAGHPHSHYPQSLPQLINPLFAAAGGTYLVLFTYFAVRASILAPHSDMIDLVYDHFRALDEGQFIDHLFSPRNHHRLLWFRSLIALDVSLFRGTGLPLVISAAVAQVGIALVLAKEVRRVAGGLVAPLAVIAAMLVFMAANVANVSQAVNTAYVRCTFFSVLALTLGASAAEQRGGWGRWCAAMAATTAASFSLALALALWPILAFMAWRGNASRLTASLVAVAGAVFCGAYMSGQSAGAPLQQILEPGQLGKVAAYFFAYLGLPWTRGALLPGQILGAVLLGASLFALFRYGLTKSTHTQRLALGLILFSLSGAVLAAVGRSHMSTEINVPVRYAVLMAPLHVAFLLLVTPTIVRAWERRPRYVVYGLIAALALLVAQQALVGPVVVRAAERAQQAITMYHQGGRTPGMLEWIHPDLEQAAFKYADMRRRGVYLQWLDVPPDSTPAVAPNDDAFPGGDSSDIRQFNFSATTHAA